MEVIVMELGVRKKNGFWSLCAYDCKNYTLQEQGKKSCHLRVWCIKNSSRLHHKERLKKVLKDMKAVPGEECITQHKPLVYDFKIRKVKDTTWRQCKEWFQVTHQQKQRKSSQEEASVAGF